MVRYSTRYWAVRESINAAYPNVKQNAGYRFSRRILRVTILLKQQEGRHALVYLDRGDAGRWDASRG
jgi:hypothetical protein